MQYPLSRDELAAMAKYVTSVRKQLQDVSDLFSARYGQSSAVAKAAMQALISSTRLENQMLDSDGDDELAADAVQPKSSANTHWQF